MDIMFVTLLPAILSGLAKVISSIADLIRSLRETRPGRRTTRRR